MRSGSTVIMRVGAEGRLRDSTEHSHRTLAYYLSLTSPPTQFIHHRLTYIRCVTPIIDMIVKSESPWSSQPVLLKKYRDGVELPERRPCWTIERSTS